MKALPLVQSILEMQGKACGKNNCRGWLKVTQQHTELGIKYIAVCQFCGTVWLTVTEKVKLPEDRSLRD